jgi:hypothetical protein
MLSSVHLGFSELPGLHEEDFVTLCVIENFLDFKMGEVWQEIVTELDMEGVKLVPPDGAAIDTILRATEERGLGEHIDHHHHHCFAHQFLMCLISCGNNAELYSRTIS